MSGLYIKGITRKPTSCTECPCWDYEYGHCQVDDRIVQDNRPDDKCRVVFIRDHRDMISAQQLHAELEIWLKEAKELAENSRGMAENYYTGIATGFSRAITILNDFERPIIIPADKG